MPLHTRRRLLLAPGAWAGTLLWGASAARAQGETTSRATQPVRKVVGGHAGCTHHGPGDHRRRQSARVAHPRGQAKPCGVWQPPTLAAVEVPPPVPAVNIASTGETRLALLRDGTMWAWSGEQSGTGLLGAQNKVPVAWPMALLQPT